MKILKYIITILVFLYSLIAFFPKEKVLNYLNTKLIDKKIYIDYEKFNDKLLAFEIKGIKPFYEDIKVANIQKIKFKIFLFDNKIVLNNFLVSSGFRDFIPNIKKVFIRYSVFNPKKIVLKANFVGAKLNGFINIFNRKVFLRLQAKSSFRYKYKMVLKYFKKTKKGLVFEYNF